MSQIQITWQHFAINGRTCNRCFTTGNSLHQVIDAYRRQGVKIELIETVIPESAIADSNTLTFNGIPLESLLGLTSLVNCCDSCSELIGKQSQCRTIRVGSANYDAIPKAIIELAIQKLLPD